LTYASGQGRRLTYDFFERFGGYYSGTLNGKFSVLLASLQGNYSFSSSLTFSSLVEHTATRLTAVPRPELAAVC
jgi:hypothetical protein